MNPVMLALTAIVLCNSIAIAKTDDEYRADLFRLVRAGDEGAIKKYFSENGTCKNKDLILGCGDEKGIPLGRIVTIEDFLKEMNSSIAHFRSKAQACERNVSCLGGIYVKDLDDFYSGGRTRTCEKGDGCELVPHTVGRGNTIYTVRNPDKFGASVWLPESVLGDFRNAFISASASTNKISEKAVAGELAQRDSENKMFKLLQKKKCTTLGRFTIVQKLGEYLYELATPDSVHGGQCWNSAGGECGEAFKVRGSHVLLQTTESSFSARGYLPFGFYAKSAGSKKIKTKDGFEEVFPMYIESTECREIWEKHRRK